MTALLWGRCSRKLLVKMASSWPSESGQGSEQLLRKDCDALRSPVVNFRVQVHRIFDGGPCVVNKFAITSSEIKDKCVV